MGLQSRALEVRTTWEPRAPSGRIFPFNARFFGKCFKHSARTTPLGHSPDKKDR